jgi:hypothetical protein
LYVPAQEVVVFEVYALEEVCPPKLYTLYNLLDLTTVITLRSL